ncbi:TetR family transcriptional regulator [Corynebacterium lubricantis]|uniref:TetR family transcriptional regulator n=1 Tax=Corynebacterium lubricantis TaxID=541095 RepID=UPI00036EB791|nr:TetR family transcriptional regulator [Corynebacterium lubricantis]
MNTPASQPRDLREMTRAAVRAQIADVALQLFDENGFDETTVDDIAQATGISRRSFFRYFPTKEDVVIGDLIPAGEQLRDLVAEQLTTETSWDALHQALRKGGAQIDAEPEHWLQVMRVINSAASLRARNIEKHLTWSSLLIPLISEHCQGEEKFGDLVARSLVGSAFACFDAALASWTEGEAAAPFQETLDAAFYSLTSPTNS